jgi:hypothetical protein
MVRGGLEEENDGDKEERCAALSITPLKWHTGPPSPPLPLGPIASACRLLGRALGPIRPCSVGVGCSVLSEVFWVKYTRLRCRLHMRVSGLLEGTHFGRYKKQSGDQMSHASCFD